MTWENASKTTPSASRRLERSTQGADWLIDRWEGLADALESRGQWDDAQRNLAFDLLGTSPILRDGHARVPAAVDRDGLMNLVKDEVGRLADEQRTTLSPLDTHEQDLACCGMPVEPDAETKRLRKYESDLSREWRWAYEQLFKLRSDPSRLTRVEARLSKFPLPAMENPAPESVAESQTNVVAPLNVAVVEDDEGMIWSNPAPWPMRWRSWRRCRRKRTRRKYAASAPVPTPVPVSTPIVARPTAPRFVPSGAKGGNRQQRRAAQKRAHAGGASIVPVKGRVVQVASVLPTGAAQEASPAVRPCAMRGFAPRKRAKTRYSRKEAARNQVRS